MDSGNFLGEFLRARRELTGPEEAGLGSSRARRTPGLRRHDVAMLAGISVDYYIRLEQGRERHPSPSVLGALARVLRLTPEAEEHLYDLALREDRPRRIARPEEQVSPYLLRLMSGWVTTPAFVCDRWMDILAVNPIAETLLEGLNRVDNMVSMVFTDPLARRFYRDWEKIAHNRAAHLRAMAGPDVDDPRLTELVDELSEQSPEFRRIWRRHEVNGLHRETKDLHHPEVGDLTITCEALYSTGARNQQLVTVQAEPGSPSDWALHALAEKAGSPVSHPI
ncbi:transcriptional regulator [Planotetraspora thailandica]|uniref:Transcriptional regulator n=1 Tax=Planotetraspora thailandica TaxID=487172 RepID=A0A8J3Y2D3_9ACTN|nr:helix-turn-helix transcriptional regulator [Planotetraspora thailandica]GII59643.1 transcriptional regulator [Planotetraspora thailandica]